MQMLEGHRARKRFGQNFLHDEYWISRIARAVDAQPGEFIVEIGPGQAALTRELVGGAGHVNAVEIDRDLAAWLKTQFAESELTLIEADALTLDWTTVAGEKRMRVVGNLPYNISSPLLFHLMKAASCVIDQHFMLQREVVDRMTAAPGTKTYGRLSVMLQWRYKMHKLFDVPPVARTTILGSCLSLTARSFWGLKEKVGLFVGGLSALNNGFALQFRSLVGKVHKVNERKLFGALLGVHAGRADFLFR